MKRFTFGLMIVAYATAQQQEEFAWETHQPMDIEDFRKAINEAIYDRMRRGEESALLLPGRGEERRGDGNGRRGGKGRREERRGNKDRD